MQCVADKQQMKISLYFKIWTTIKNVANKSILNICLLYENVNMTKYIYKRNTTFLRDTSPHFCQVQILLAVSVNQLWSAIRNLDVGNKTFTSVSYTHLDVYKRQEEKYSSSSKLCAQ